MVFCPEHPKRDHYLKFTPLSKTTSIPVRFIWDSPPGGGGGEGLKDSAAHLYLNFPWVPLPRESTKLKAN